MTITTMIAYFKEVDIIMTKNKEYLIDLDSVVGDGDLGLTMSDGFKAAYHFVSTSAETDIGKLLYGAGKTMSTAVPSTMGTLMASGLMQAGKELKGKESLTTDDFTTLFSAYFTGVANRGKAKVGEKTFLDGLYPAVESMKADTTQDMKLFSENARIAAHKGFKDTTSLLAIHGRAATRGEASRTLEDPGAAVAYLLMCALENTFQ